jgi:hypothetical protein
VALETEEAQRASSRFELAVLAVVGYQGPYRNRLSEEVHVGAVEPVPWDGLAAADQLTLNTATALS